MQLGFTRDSPWKHLDFTCGKGGLSIQASHAGSAKTNIYSVSYVIMNKHKHKHKVVLCNVHVLINYRSLRFKSPI